MDTALQCTVYSCELVFRKKKELSTIITKNNYHAVSCLAKVVKRERKIGNVQNVDTTITSNTGKAKKCKRMLFKSSQQQQQPKQSFSTDWLTDWLFPAGHCQSALKLCMIKEHTIVKSSHSEASYLVWILMNSNTQTALMWLIGDRSVHRNRCCCYCCYRRPTESLYPGNC